MYKSTRQLQRAFRAEFKDQLDFKLITDHSGTGKMYKTDVRVAFCDWLDNLSKNGLVSDRLAQQAHLSPSR